jgi:WD repeat-containing protein 19
VGPQLAIGTGKGNLLLYNKVTRKKIPVLGKHPRRITCGGWSSDNRLALGSEDRTLTLSNSNGDTLEQTELKYPPLDVQFAVQKSDDRKGEDQPDTTVSINMGGKSLLLYNLTDPDNPVELAFQQRYGTIVTYRWFGDGYLMIGFSEGFLVVISTHMREIGEELFSGQFHKTQLTTLAYSPVLQRTATCGDGGIKVVDMNEWKEVQGDSMTINEEVTMMKYTLDGQILTVGTSAGVVHNFLARMPNIHDHYDTRIAYLSSLRELSVVDAVTRPPPITIGVSIEPSFVALGPKHVAVGMNNRVWYYRCETNSQELVNEQEYLGTVDTVKLNREYAAVLCEGLVTLHLVEPQSQMDQQRKIFPEREDSSYKCRCCVLTRDFLIYGTSVGSLEYFYIPEWVTLSGSEHRHEEGIKAIYPNAPGTRVIFKDNNNDAFLYSPVTSHVIKVPEFSQTCTKIMWDSADWGVFVTVDAQDFCTYIYSPLTINGPQISKLGPLEIHQHGDMSMVPQPTRIPAGHSLILAHDGYITCQLNNGTLGTVLSSTHNRTQKQTAQPTSDWRYQSFAQNLALLRLKTAWHLALQINTRSHWLALSGKAMEQLDIEMAIRVHRQLGDAGMVMGLERIRHIEDKNLLAGHIAMLFADYTQAQDLFLTSSRPATALEMRRDLLHWDQALKLARTLAKEQVPELSVQYAQQLEFKGEHDAALRMYESGCNGVDENGTPMDVSDAQQQTCMAGIARMTLRLGDVRRGMRLATESQDKQLCRECGAILESMKQYADAAILYEKGEQYEKAVQIFIMSKDLAKAEPLMDKVVTPKLHLQYAKAKEANGAFAAAAKAYELGRDLDSVVRLQLEHLSCPEKAFAIVRETSSAAGAQLVARYCQTVGDFRGAIEFLLMAKRSSEAFALAQTHNEMDVYSKTLGDDISPDEAMSIATFWENQGEPGKAGEFFSLCAQYSKALKLFLQCGEREMDKAIDVVGKARSDMLTHTLIDFLMGETDGVPKDPNFIFRLYMALGNYPQAAKTAIIIARQEQELGNYKVAHNILFETHRELEIQKIRVPQALRRALLLLHSYILVRKLVKQGDHQGAARMLLRVAKNISKFPSHVVPILTSTVITCTRAGLRASAFEYASMLMRPEYRGQIDAKYVPRLCPVCAPSVPRLFHLSHHRRHRHH